MIEEFSGANRFLSNFWPVPNGVIFERVSFPTVEHAYQAAKSLRRDDWLHVAALAKPGDAKRWGRLCEVRKDWDVVKITVMTDLVRQKFQQEPLRGMLLRTGAEELREGNTWNDVFWGVCSGRGENRLGKILMQVRRELRGSIKQGDAS